MRWFTPAVVLLIAWGALAFGAEYPWAYAPLLVGSAAVGCAALVSPAQAPLRLPPVAAALALVAAGGALQVAPLPERVVSTVSPARAAHDYAALHRTAMPSLPGAAPAEAPQRTLSIRPSRTALGLAFLVAFGLFFTGCTRALQVVSPAGVARGLAVVGLLVALAAIAQQGSGTDRVYGFWLPRHPLQPAAPFINRHHTAGWIIMTQSVVIGYLCGRLAGAVRRAAGNPVRWLASRDASELIIVAFTVLVMTSAVVSTSSRSGVMCLAVAFGLFGARALRWRAAARWRAAIPVGLAAVLAAAVGLAGADSITREFAPAAMGADLAGRLAIWRDTARIAWDFPLTGTGLNTYGIAMLAYQTAQPHEHLVEAHNDYLQLAAEGGLLLATPIAIAALLFIRDVRRRFREAAADTLDGWVRFGAVTGIAAIALQSLVDFSLQMPGNAVLLALLLAIAMHRSGARPAALYCCT